MKGKNRSYSAEDIFQTRFWCNEKGLRAIEAESLRREAKTIMLFGQTYFPEFFPSNYPELHVDILALMLSTSNLKAVAVPRGHAKSTIVSFLLVIYRIVMKKRKFIVIVSESEEKAKDFVIRLRDELEYNKKLIRDFCIEGQYKTTDWSKTDFVTSTDIRVSAKGAGQSLRGMIFKDTRPDMVVLDDIETDETAGNDSVVTYILSNILPATNKRGIYDVCYVGTIIKDMAALHQMLINDEWTCAKWEAIDENDDMIAPMLLPPDEYKRTKKMYQQLGKMSVFYAEMHNNPMVSDDAQTFKREYFQYYENLPENCKYFIFYDIAMPPSGRIKIKRVDYSVLLVLATDSHKNWYVVRCIANRDAPSSNRKLLYNLTDKYGTSESPVLVQMETISAQRGMYLEIRDEMRKLGKKFPLREIPSHATDKGARIEQLQPMYEAGRIYHNKKDCQDLEQELLMFGRTPHDDRSDTLSFAIGRVSYPNATKVPRHLVRDHWDKFLNDKSPNSWKLV